MLGHLRDKFPETFFLILVSQGVFLSTVALSFLSMEITLIIHPCNPLVTYIGCNYNTIRIIWIYWNKMDLEYRYRENISFGVIYDVAVVWAAFQINWTRKVKVVPSSWHCFTWTGSQRSAVTPFMELRSFRFLLAVAFWGSHVDVDSCLHRSDDSRLNRRPATPTLCGDKKNCSWQTKGFWMTGWACCNHGNLAALLPSDSEKEEWQPGCQENKSCSIWSASCVCQVIVWFRSWCVCKNTR